MVAATLILGGDLNISDQNNWGGPEQKIKFGGEQNLMGVLKFWAGAMSSNDAMVVALKKKKTLWPLFMNGVQLPQGYSHFE